MAILLNMSVKTKISGIELKVPFLTAAPGSRAVAKRNQHPLAVSAAISGMIVVMGENAVGMNLNAKFDAKGDVAAPST